MQLQMFFKAWHAHKFFECRFAHLHGVRKSHVVFDQGKYLVCIVVGEAQAAADFLRHFHPDVHVAVETNAIRSDAERRRLADVVQERAPRQGWWTRMAQFFQQQQSMDKNITFGVKLRRLLDAFHGFDFRKKLMQQSGFIEQ